MRWELGASTRFLLHGTSTFSSEKKCTIKLVCDHPCSASWCWIRRNWRSWEKKDKWKVQLATPHQSPVPCKNTTRSMVAMQKSLCRRLATSCVSCFIKLRRLTVTNGRSKPLTGTRSNLSDHTALACLSQMDLPITYVLHPVGRPHFSSLFLRPIISDNTFGWKSWCLDNSIDVAQIKFKSACCSGGTVKCRLS